MPLTEAGVPARKVGGVPVVHSRNEPVGCGRKADCGRGQGRPSRPEGVEE
jgi:hypothetical protein